MKNQKHIFEVCAGSILAVAALAMGMPAQAQDAFTLEYSQNDALSSIIKIRVKNAADLTKALKDISVIEIDSNGTYRSATTIPQSEYDSFVSGFAHGTPSGSGANSGVVDNLRMSIRGVKIDIRSSDSFNSDGSKTTRILLNAPALGIDNQSFSGSDLASAFDKAGDYIYQRDDILEKYLIAGVSQTPFDPVAGTPSSLVSQMLLADGNVSDQVGLGWGAPQSSPADHAFHRLSFSPNIGHFEVDDISINTLTVPTQFVRSWGDDGGHVYIDLPLSASEIGGNTSYAASLGIGASIPVLRRKNLNWNVVPAVRAGTTYSGDYATAAVLYSGGLSSVLNWSLDTKRMAWTSSYTHYKSSALTIDDIKLNYNLSIDAYRNVLHVEGDLPYHFLGRQLVWETDAAINALRGTEQYVKNYQELSIALSGKRDNQGLKVDAYRLAFSLVSGDRGYRGYNVNLKYAF